ncbi:MAG: 2-dehydropantoate 2-reductase [Chloroflexi bacterium]|nr:2-dehydropantoate 2-reductase [Chloroflexota bacterium]
MKAAIFGAGGLGGYFGGLLAQAGHEVTFIARGAHLEAIRERGLHVRSIHGDFTISPARATGNSEEIGPVDLTLFAVKTYQIDEAARSLPPLVGPETTVLTTQNGVDAHERVAAVVGEGVVMPGAVWISSGVESPGVIRQTSSFRRIAFGELSGEVSPRAEAILAAFQPTGAQVELSTDIRKVLWTKFAFLASYSGVSSLVRLPAGEVTACAETMQIVWEAITEVESIARAKGIALDVDVVEKTMAFIKAMDAGVTSSMQRDVAAGRRLEIEALSGTVVRYGRELGIPRPVHRFIYAALKPVDARAGG